MGYLFWLSIALLLTLAVGTLPAVKCPKNCNCTDTSTAICNSLDVDPFPDIFAKLKIVNPPKPLELTRNIFHDLGFKTVNYIHIENATISKFDKEAFGQLLSITGIRIVSSDIQELPPNFISKIDTLRTLNLKGSKLRQFTTLESENLEELDMSQCNISEITENMFNNLPELTYLNLENNRINRIHPLAFINLTNLEELFLARNNLSHLMPNLLENNFELINLDLSYNPIRQFSLNIISFLEKLLLKGCKLTSFNATLGKNFDFLPFLDLSENEISEISQSTFAKMPKLETINLSSNKLEKLDPSVFANNSKLLRIILDNNNFTKLPQFKNEQDFFEVISFSCNNCNLKEITPGTFEYMRGLTILRLSKNLLTKIGPEVFKTMHTLREIDISYNKIRRFGFNDFSRLNQLERLILAGNPLEEPVDGAQFFSTRALKTLDMSSCNLSALWYDNYLLATTPSIRELNFANNNISSVSPRDLQVFTNLQVFNIQNNPIKCSAVLRDTITWLTEHGVYPHEVKTHESFEEDVAVFEETEDKLPSWKSLAKDACKDEDYFDYDADIEVNSKTWKNPSDFLNNFPVSSDEYEEVEDDDDDDDDYNNYIDYDQKSDKPNSIDDDEEDDDKLFEQVKTEIDLDKLAIESRRLRERKMEEYSYLSPTLVFILTAASVLVIAANIMLLVLRSKGAFNSQRDGNLPHFKILQWGTVNKLKKHSGSVYQQLSEERSAPTTPKVNRYQKLPTVHNTIP